MSGEGCKNSDVVEFRHCLIESDTLPKEEQLRKIRELNLPCSAIVDSGGKSVHAVVKIDAGKDEKLYRERVGELHAFLEKHGFPVDTACKNASRLSRIAAVTRNGNRQRLIATNVGAKSFADWQKALNVPKYTIVPAGELRAIDPNDMSDNILGNRFLCRNGSWLIVAQSGIGKSVMAMQMALHFAVGKRVFGIPVQKPSKVLFIQAENNSIDLSRPFHSVIKKADFSPYENSIIDKNLNFISEESSSGDGQYDAFVRALRKVYKGTLGRRFPMLTNYAVTIPPGGRTDAFVQTVITWQFDGRVFRTRGLDADQTEAAIKATMKMLNLIEGEFDTSV